MAASHKSGMSDKGESCLKAQNLDQLSNYPQFEIVENIHNNCHFTKGAIAPEAYRAPHQRLQELPGPDR